MKPLDISQYRAGSIEAELGMKINKIIDLVNNGDSLGDTLQEEEELFNEEQKLDIPFKDRYYNRKHNHINGIAGCGECQGFITDKESKEKELFDMVYRWGKTGIVTDEKCNAFQDLLKEIKK